METVTSIRYRRRPSTLGNFMDITQRKRAEEALRQSEELYRAAVEQSAEAIYLIDAETKRIIQLNPALQRLLGYTFEELKNMSIYDYLAHRRDDIDHHLEHILTEGGHPEERPAFRRLFRERTMIMVSISNAQQKS